MIVSFKRDWVELDAEQVGVEELLKADALVSATFNASASD